jgi:hypothetical protein
MRDGRELPKLVWNQTPRLSPRHAIRVGQIAIGEEALFPRSRPNCRVGFLDIQVCFLCHLFQLSTLVKFIGQTHADGQEFRLRYPSPMRNAAR